MRGPLTMLTGLLVAPVLALMPTILFGSAAMAAPNVVVTVAPVHSLVAGVMGEVATPRLLIGAGLSPHGFQLKPSDARALAAADLVVEVGAGLERALDKPLATLAAKASVLVAAEMEGVTVLPYREGGHDGHDHDGDGHERDEHDEHNEPDDHDAAAADPHLWLDPRNARAIVAAVAATLARLDPASGATYRANAAEMTARLDALDAALADRLRPARGQAYVVFHDGYQYLEARYGLAAPIAVAVNPELQPGAGHLREVVAMIAARGARCLFVEPQFAPRLAEILASEAGLRTATLDPLGVELPVGLELYFGMMRRNGEALAGCLAAGG